jgi:hypothetical protein
MASTRRHRAEDVRVVEILDAATGRTPSRVTVPWRDRDELAVEYEAAGITGGMPGGMGYREFMGKVRLGRPDLTVHQLGWESLADWMEWPDGSWRCGARPFGRRHLVRPRRSPRCTPLSARSQSGSTPAGPSSPVRSSPRSTRTTIGRWPARSTSSATPSTTGRFCPDAPAPGPRCPGILTRSLPGRRHITTLEAGVGLCRGQEISSARHAEAGAIASCARSGEFLR